MKPATRKAVKALIKAGLVHSEVDFLLRYGDIEFPPIGYTYWSSDNRNGFNQLIRHGHSGLMHPWAGQHWVWKEAKVGREWRPSNIRLVASYKRAQTLTYRQHVAWCEQFPEEA